MEKGYFIDAFTKLLIFELGLVIAVFLALSILRYFNNSLFIEAKDIYTEYVGQEISLSLVLDGE